MALIECPECKAKVSNKAKACPNCGYPMEQVVLMLCPECKSVISNDMQSCPNCGYPFEEKEESIICNINGVDYEFADFYRRLMKIGKKYDYHDKELTAIVEEIEILTSMASAYSLCDQIVDEEKVPEEYECKTKEQIRKEVEASVAKMALVVSCPYCRSTDVKKLSLTGKALSIGGLGILSNKIGKTYQCRNCKSTW